MENSWYEIRIRGILDAHWAEFLDNAEIRYEQGRETVLRGPVRDQALLHGLFDLLTNLNLTLLSMNRIDPPGSTRKKEGE